MAAESASTGLNLGTGLGIAFSLALLGLTAWRWAGRTPDARRWVDQMWGPQATLGVWPGMGVTALTISLGMALDVDGGMSVLVMLGLLVGITLMMLGAMFLLPPWWGPRWYRQLPRSKRRRRSRSRS